MDPFYLKVDEIKKNVEETNFEIALNLYNILTESFTEPYHEFEIKRLNLDKLMNGVSKKHYKLKLEENISLCEEMIKNNDITQAKYYLNEAYEKIDNIHDPFLTKQKFKIRKLRKLINITEEPPKTYLEPAFDEISENKNKERKEIPEFDNEYYKETSKFIDDLLKQNLYLRVKIIPESDILSNVCNAFDHLYYKIHNDSDGDPALVSLVFLKIEASKGKINLRYPEVDYKSKEKLNKKGKNSLLNNIIHFPIRMFKHLINCMGQKDYETFRITTEIYEDLFVKIFPKAKILQYPLRVNIGGKEMEIDAHGLILLKNSLYLDKLPGLRSDHIYFLIRDNIQNFIDYQDKKYFAYISAKKDAIENYDKPKQKQGFFGRQSKIGFIATPILLLSALISFLNQDLLNIMLVFDSVLILLIIGHVLFQWLFGTSELYRVSEWCILSRDQNKWEKVFKFVRDENTVMLISAECSNFSFAKRLRNPKKFSIPFFHNFSLRMFLKKKKLQKNYINPATKKLKSRSKKINKKIKEGYTKFSSGISNKISNLSAPKPKIKIKKKREKVTKKIFKPNKQKIKTREKIKVRSSAPRNTVKVKSINSFLDD